MDPLRWHSWLDIGTLPNVGFAVPFAIPSGDIWWDDVAGVAAVVMDRGRLLHSLDGADVVSWLEWPAIGSFVTDQIVEVRSGMSGAPASLQVPKRRRKSSAQRASST